MSVTVLDVFQSIEKLKSIPPTQMIPLEDSIGRVIAQDVIARYSLPRFDNSAMDGYAVRLEDLGTTQDVKATIFAGDNVSKYPSEGIVKIMTGAPIPHGAYCVVPIEDTQLMEGGGVKLPLGYKQDAHIRKEGEEIKTGDRIVSRGETLSWGEIALCASQGITHLCVYRQPRVVIFATGEELAPHFASLGSHQIYNSNSLMLMAKARKEGANPSFLHVASDTISSIKENISKALDSELIVTTGGASVGDADLTKRALYEMGMEEIFTKVEIKPGKPTSLGRIGKTLVLILPGNPLACAINFALFGVPLIRALGGSQTPYHALFPTRLNEKLSLKGGMTTIVLGELTKEGFSPLKKQGPNMVSPVSKAQAFLVIDPKITELSQGEEVYVSLLDGENFQQTPPLSFELS